MFEVAANYLQDKGLVDENWMAFMLDQGIRVALYRDYYDGFHRQRLSREMRNLLQLDYETDRYSGFSRYGGYTLFDSFNSNYCDMIVNKMVDRLAIERIEPGSGEAGDDAVEWIDRVSEFNRLDALQIDVNIAMLRDGVAWIMVDWDDEAQLPLLVYEPAWDGYTGISGVYDTTGKKLAAAIKVWGASLAQQQANVYLPGDIVRFPEGERMEDVPGRDGRELKYLGIPLVPFGGHNRSELANIISLQDSLNNMLASMVATGLRSGFQIKFAKQFKMPRNVGPGQIVEAGVKDENGNYEAPEDPTRSQALANILSNMTLEAIDAGEITPLSEAAEFFIEQISTVSSTPVPAFMGGDSVSGESMKEREKGLIGKVNRAQVMSGNNWEDVFRMANMVHRTYGNESVPELDTFAVRWVNPELRNDKEIRELAKQLHEWGFTREALRIVSTGSIVSYDEDDIDNLLEEQQEDVNGRTPQPGGAAFPDFGGEGEAEGLDALAAPVEGEILL